MKTVNTFSQKMCRGTCAKKFCTHCMHLSTTPPLFPRPTRWASITSASQLPVTVGDQNIKNQNPLCSSSPTAKIYHFIFSFLWTLILRAVKTLRKYREIKQFLMKFWEMLRIYLKESQGLLRKIVKTPAANFQGCDPRPCHLFSWIYIPLPALPKP